MQERLILGALIGIKPTRVALVDNCAPLMLRNSGAQGASEGVSAAMVTLDSAKRESAHDVGASI